MKKTILFLFALTLAAPLGLFAGSGTELGNPVIAKGKGIEIRRGELDAAMAGLRSQIPQSETLTAERLVLNHLIQIKLLLAKATDADKVAGTKTVETQLASLVQNFGGQEAFNQRLKAMGATENEIRNKLIDDATAQAALERELKISVSEDAVKKYYQTRMADYEQPEMVRISHILVLTVDPVTREPLPPEQLQYRRQKIDDLLKAARAGQDFSALAKQYSDDAGSKETGGVLLPFPRGQMSPEIDAAAFSLTNNQVSDVITTSAGYQIVKLLQKIPAQKTDAAAVAANIRQGLMQQQVSARGPAYLENLSKAAGVKILDSSLETPAALPAVKP